MSAVEFVAYEPPMAEELSAMWLRSFNQALAPFRDPKTLHDRRRFLTEDLARKALLTVAKDGNDIIGFMAQNGESIEQLYLHVQRQRQGIGSRFIELAKAASPKRLHLYTFQRNLKARRFYREHGFQEIDYGHTNMEGLADVELEWIPVSVQAKT
ncbi:MAG: GNAT family N-acetyltransferase [Gammaproteobacteria bacterium]|nr:GNAT family N-acetyltransferase [Gammaproteobacteria bacterium]